jgi:hypothetical protein
MTRTSYAGIARGADGDGQGGWLQKRKVHVHMESLKADKAARGGRKLLRHGIEVIRSSPQPEIRKMVRQQFVAQETGELLRLGQPLRTRRDCRRRAFLGSTRKT